MQELELLEQFIMIGSTERGSLDSTVHWYYNEQVLRIKAFFCVVAVFKQKKRIISLFQEKVLTFFQQNSFADSL